MTASRPREDARRQHERPHVLVVTDDPSLSGFLSEGLIMGGFWVSEISHGIQVLEVFRLRSFDLIVIDDDLGTFDAGELIRRLRAPSGEAAGGPPRTSKPIVVMASRDPGITPQQRESLGIEAILQAPIDLEDVVRELHAVFARWRSAHPDTPLADESLE